MRCRELPSHCGKIGVEIHLGSGLNGSDDVWIVPGDVVVHDE